MDKEKIRILYLDDEENNLNSFKAAFRRDYKIFITTSAQEAVQILTDHDIHVVISDQKMPNISGVEFFELIVPDFPNPVRMLLTGYADIEAVIDAINKGQIYRYIAKPWNEQELKITIENAYEVYQNRMELSEKSKALEKAYAELERFVFSASHDLRVPLASIKGAVKQAKQESPDSPLIKHIDLIERNTQSMDVLVQNILDYYRKRRDGESLSNVHFQDIVSSVMDMHANFDGASDMVFQQEISQDVQFMSDELGLKMILNNLVSNAIKSRDSDKGQNMLKMTISADGSKATIQVEDNGVGIAREELGQVFESSQDSGSGRTPKGFGLHVVRETVQDLGGSVKVASEPGQGTTFSLEIPNKNG